MRDKTEASTGSSSFADMRAYVRARWVPYCGIIALFSLMLIVAYSQGWLAATFERTWGWSAEKYVLINAIILLSVGPATVNFAGWLCDRLHKKGRVDAPYLILFTGVAILVPSAFIATLMPTPELAMAVLAITTFGIAMASAVGVTALLHITPTRISAQVTALYYMVAGLAGLFLGPLTVSLLSDNVFGNENLRYVIGAVDFWCSGVNVRLVCNALLRRRARKDEPAINTPPNEIKPHLNLAPSYDQKIVCTKSPRPNTPKSERGASGP